MGRSAVLMLLLAAYLTYAQDSNTFESLLDEASEIATKNNLNIEYLPSVVSVLRASEMKMLGIRTLGEALDTLPGIQTQITELGFDVGVVRGFKLPNAYLSDKIKVLVDGVSINSHISGTNHFYMNFPIDLIERIDILRGPASTIYGSDAIYGALNVITRIKNKTECDTLSAATGSYGYRYGGVSFCDKFKDFKIGIDGYYQDNDKAIGVTGGYVDKPQSFNRDFETNEEMQDFSVGLSAEQENLKLIARLKKSKSGNFYGYEGRLESENDKRRFDTSAFVENSYKLPLTDGEIELKAGYMHFGMDIDGRRRQAAFVDEKYFNTTYKDYKLNQDEAWHDIASENTLYAEASYMHSGIKNHKMLFSVGGGVTKVVDNYHTSTLEEHIFNNISAFYDPSGVTLGEYYKSTGESLPDGLVSESRLLDTKNFGFAGEWSLYMPRNTNLLNDDVKREYVTALIQDVYAAHEDVDITVGARYTKYSDFGSEVSIRAGAVYRISDTLIYKAMFGSAYRAPSFMESYALPHIGFNGGNKDLKPEESIVYESALIYKPNSAHKISANIYYADLHSVIENDDSGASPSGYKNSYNRFSKGLEIEYGFKPSYFHLLFANATFSHTNYITADDKIYQSMPDISNKMYKAGYIFRPFNSLSLGTLARWYSGTVQNQDYTKNTTVKSQSILDETITYNISKESTASFTIKNLFDYDVRMPSYYYRNAGGIIREGRYYVLGFSTRF